jgi:hypothetical protein
VASFGQLGLQRGSVRIHVTQDDGDRGLFGLCRWDAHLGPSDLYLAHG